MDLGLDGVLALVVGGTGLIGREVATQLRAEGARVVLAARSADALADAAAALGDEVESVVMDTTDQASVDHAIAEVNDRLGTIGVLVNTAAPPAQTIDPATADQPGTVAEGFTAKAMGYLRVTNAVLPQMREAGYGRVVQVGGQNVRLTNNVTAAVRNAGVSAAAKVLADQLAGTGVSINVVDPGTVTEQPSAQVERGLPGESSPREVAALVVFLCSLAARGISGESVSVGHRVRGVQVY